MLFLIYIAYCSRLASPLCSAVNMPRTTRCYHWSYDQECRWYRVWFRATRSWLNSVCNSSTTSSSQPVEQPNTTSQPTGSAALLLRSASDPAPREPAQFVCMPCRFHRPEYSHLATACHKMPELYWSTYHPVAVRPACAPDGALCVCISLAHEIRGSQPFHLLKLACACQPE